MYYLAEIYFSYILVKHISIVVPAYNEHVLLPETIGTIYTQMQSLPAYSFEIVIVNDGSRDATRSVITDLTKTYPEVKWVDFSRNFGKEIALSAGLEYATGDAVITLDADGQHPISKIPDFLSAREEWYAIVYNKRPEIQWASILKRVTSRGFYKVFNLLSDVKMESQTTDYRLLDRRVVDVFKTFSEKNRMYRGIIDLIWFNKKALEFDALPSPDGRAPSYNYSKLMKLAIDSITSFSVRPLKAISWLWVLITTLSAAWLLAIFVMLVFMNNPRWITNLWAFTLINTFFMWIVMMWLGLIAVYIAKIHEEVQGRPLYIVQEAIGFESK